MNPWSLPALQPTLQQHQRMTRNQPVLKIDLRVEFTEQVETERASIWTDPGPPGAATTAATKATTTSTPSGDAAAAPTGKETAEGESRRTWPWHCGKSR